MTAERGRALVINLCTLPTPIAVPQPRASQLTRYSFFLSRCTINGQRQFQLNMGYFESAAQAQKWLVILKRVYPGAQVSQAPEPQPEFLTATQELRILNLGQTDSESLSSTGRSRAAGDLPASQELFVRDRGPAARRRNSPTLEDTLDDLRAAGFDGVVEDDDLNATGVRHLRIDVVKTSATGQSANKTASRSRKGSR
jgi:hypothetical protein